MLFMKFKGKGLESIRRILVPWSYLPQPEQVFAIFLQRLNGFVFFL